jgi:chromosome segregation ATPase
MDFNERIQIPVSQPKASRGPVLLAVAGLVAAAGSAVFSWTTTTRLNAVEYHLTAVEQENAKLRDWASKELKKAGDSQTAEFANKAQELEALRAKLEEARGQVQKAAGRARAEAVKSVKLLEARLNEGELKFKEEQAALATKLSDVQQAASHAQTSISEVKTDVGQIRTEVAQTRNDLDATTQNLKRVTGDMGVMSGLIATNGKEIEALKKLGDRHIYEFTLSRKDKPQSPSKEVALTLKKVDAKKNRYTLEVLADDKSIEKRDRTVNEPVQFYVSRARQPYEIVINKVDKNSVTGYLAVPKVLMARD